jgi:hypothetical protein
MVNAQGNTLAARIDYGKLPFGEPLQAEGSGGLDQAVGTK